MFPSTKNPIGKFLFLSDPPAEARSSGGLARGGSFNRSSSSSSSSSYSYSNSSSSSEDSDGGIIINNNDGDASDHNDRDASVEENDGDNTNDPIVVAIVISILAIVLIIVIWKSLESQSEEEESEEAEEFEEETPPELSNNIVTVSKLKIALLSNARHVQQQLTTTSEQADLESREGLANFLQEAALTLLQASEYWSHAPSHSETFPNRAEASKFFEKLSVEERSNFSQETFRNEEGEIQEKEVEPNPEEDPGAYIVVTLLVGTKDDKPLFDEIHSPEDLEAALKEMAATTSDYLLVFELLWSPQDSSDSLTYDELLTEYTDMLQIA